MTRFAWPCSIAFCNACCATRNRHSVNSAGSLRGTFSWVNAIETAWFEGRALRIVYAKSAGQLSPRHVRIKSLVFDRQVTLLNCVDLETSNDRQFRLDRIKSASVLDSQRS